MLPASIISDCEARGTQIFIIAFEGQTSPSLVEGREHIWTHLGAVGKIMQTLKANDIKDIVMAGSIKRPSLFELKPDWKALKIIGRIGFNALGDNGLLSLLRDELEKEGFELHGVQKFSDHLIAGEGILGEVKPTPEDVKTIELGIHVSRAIGALDIGQAAIVQQGMVIGVEGIEGTDALIERCGKLLKTGRGGILVKTCKPQQDKDLDLPTIGPDTVEKAHRAGLCGIVIHAGNSIILDVKTVADMADKYKIFISGVAIDDAPKIQGS